MNFVPVSFVFLLQVFSVLAIEVAPYDVINSYETYEERHYPARKWVSTTKQAISWDDVEADMFQMLFNYIDGQNEQDLKIDMTSPVTNYVIFGAGPFGESNFTMSFLIPEVHEAAPPVPKNADVFIEERPDMPSVLVREFPGFASYEDYIHEAEELTSDLQFAGEDNVNTDTWYMVGYDAPFNIVNRHNEVWFTRN